VGRALSQILNTPLALSLPDQKMPLLTYPTCSWRRRLGVTQLEVP